MTRQVIGESAGKAPLPQPKASGYVGLQGNATNYAGTNHMGASVVAGGRVDAGGIFFIDLEGGLGTNWGVDCNMGHRFDFKKDMGLELSAGVSMQGELKKDDLNLYLNIKKNNSAIEIKCNESVKCIDDRMKLNAKFSYDPKWGSIKLGVEGGYRIAEGLPGLKYSIEDLSNAVVTDNGQVLVSGKPVIFNNSTPEELRNNLISSNISLDYYLTPTFEVEANAKLVKGLSVFVDGDKYNINGGIRYNF